MHRIVLTLLGSLITAFSLQASAQNYPAQPITAVVGFAPGGSADAAARVLAEEGKKVLGTDITVVNKPGAGATVGVSAVITAKPDGYTIGTTTDSPFLRAAHMMQLNFDPINDSTPLVLYAVQRNFLVVREDSPFKTMDDLLKYAKENPGKLSFGHPGIPTTLYLSFAGLTNELGIKFGSVAFPGDGQSLLAVLGGHVMAAAISAGPTMPQLKAGKVRILAVTDGTKRMEEFPQVPTFSEFTKAENVIASPAMLVFGPKGLPPAIASKLEDGFSKAANSEGFKKWGAENQTYPLAQPITGAKLKDYLGAESAKMKLLITRLGLQAKPQ